MNWYAKIAVDRQPYWSDNHIVVFQDYIGNPLNGMSNWIDFLEMGKTEPTKKEQIYEKLNIILREFFDRVEFLIQHGFNETGNLTKTNLQSILGYKSQPFSPELFYKLKGWYNRISQSK